MLLHIARDLELAVEPFALRDFFPDRFGQFCIFQRQSRLRGNCAQQLQIALRIGRFRFLRP